jgi:hypothetical protein
MTITVARRVHLFSEDRAKLQEIMGILHLDSTSEAIHKAIRMLHREALEIRASEEIAAFYPGGKAPVPDGVAEVTQEELDAADRSDW